MKNIFLLAVTILTQTICAFAQTNPAVKQTGDSDQLEGTWTLCDWIERDKTNRYSEGTIIFGDKNRVTAINGNDTLRGTFVYNAQKNPDWIDFDWKNNAGQSSQSHGILEWIDEATARVNLTPKAMARPATFEEDPDLDRSGMMKKQGIAADSYLMDDLMTGKWDITYLYEADNYSPGKKHQTFTFQKENRYQLDGTDFIPGSSGYGRYDLNTSQFPFWIDFYPDQGGKIMGLIQQHLNGYKLQIFRFEMNGGHPVQFTDVESGMPGMINFNPGFLYLQRSVYGSEPEPAPKQEPRIVAELSGKWMGIWTKTDYLFEGELFIVTNSDNIMTGKILWTLLKSPKLNDPLLGKSGIEFISGHYNADSALFFFEGTRKEDFNNVIGLDSYKLFRNSEGEVLAGKTKGGKNLWDAQFKLAKYGELDNIETPFDSVSHKQVRYGQNIPGGFSLKFSLSRQGLSAATGMISFEKVNDKWMGNIMLDQSQVKEALQDVSVSGGRISFSVSTDPSTTNSGENAGQLHGTYVGFVTPDGRLTGIFSSYRNSGDSKWSAGFVQLADPQVNVFTDSRDGNVYKTVTIGSQVWMAENLKYLPGVVGPATGSLTQKYCYVYAYDGANLTEAKATASYTNYGVLYNWSAAMAGDAGNNRYPGRVQGVCPAGWHLPSKTEFEALTAAVNKDGNALKAIGQGKGFGAGTNASGFSALLTGGCYMGTFSHSGSFTDFWSSFGGNSDVALVMSLWDGGAVIGMEYKSKYNGFCVRCLKD
ncbi:MAG: FISUMP domain-containing protein [Lentimicrobium sp.]